MTVLLASIWPLAALAACGPDPEPVFRAPVLEESRLSCAAFPEIKEVLEASPEHVFLSGTSGEAVVTDGVHRWVRFDIVQHREARLIYFGDITARLAHFECRDDLQWTADVLRDLGEAQE